MAQAINTNFDQPVENDVTLEQLDGQAPAVQVTLKNAENVYKSFLYLRKMYSSFPAKESILDIKTVDYTDYASVVIPENSTEITINNFSGSNAGIKINSGEYIIQPGEKITLPVVSPDSSVTPNVAGDTVELKGSVSYIIKNVQEY